MTFFDIINSCQEEEMAGIQYDTENKLVQLIMALKLQKLKMSQLPSLKYENLEDCLKNGLWKDGAPQTLNQAADQILSLNASDIVRFMARTSLRRSVKENLDDYADIIRRN